MEKEIKVKLQELLDLLDDPDEVVLLKEVKEKLGRIMALADHPDDIEAEKEEYKTKMNELVNLINDAIIDIDVDLDYCIPGVLITSEKCDSSGNPHILLTYNEDEYTTRTRKVSLGKTALQSTTDDLVKHVLLAIEEFKDEMDDIKMG